MRNARRVNFDDDDGNDTAGGLPVSGDADRADDDDAIDRALDDWGGGGASADPGADDLDAAHRLFAHLVARLARAATATGAPVG